jgi:hypothetical protein
MAKISSTFAATYIFQILSVDFCLEPQLVLTKYVQKSLGITMLGIMTLSIMTLSIMTLCIAAFSIMTLRITIKNCDTQHNERNTVVLSIIYALCPLCRKKANYAECHYAE